MAEKTQLTKAGYKKLQEELRYLIDVEREQVKTQLAEARAQGDLKENADYDAARSKQAEVEAKIKQYEDILNNYVLIDESSKKNNRVSLGSTVTLRNVETGREDTYMIVGTVESDPFNGKISNSCALGQAIIGKTVGDIVDIKANVNYKVEILKIVVL